MSKTHEDAIREEELKEVIELLGDTIMFKYCSEENLAKVAGHMKRIVYNRGDVILDQGHPQTEMYLVVDGQVRREREEHDAQIHYVDSGKQAGGKGTLYGSLHILEQDPSFASIHCTSDTAVVYQMTTDSLAAVLNFTEPIQQEVIYGLTKEIRRQSRLHRTPLLEQHAKPTPIFATSVAAGLESFYRSALNSWLNYRLTGQSGSWFPNMHIQTPTRILLINGFKGIRQFLEDHVQPFSTDETNPFAFQLRVGIVIAPGLIMCPFSSLLEACNAGNMNQEPLHRRWARGFVPRSVREIIFGIGLNQLSDYCEERVSQTTKNPTIRNAAGSLIAGVLSGYVSHVPHNLSTLKLLNPSKSYLEHFADMCAAREKHIPSSVTKPHVRRLATIFLTLLAPRGVAIRTTQIVGSFIILNGTINYLDRLQRPKF